MSRLSYETAETLIYDPVTTNRAGTRSLMYGIGFRRIETVGTLEALADRMKRRPPDLVMCEAQGVEADLCKLIQSLRQGTTGFNPFIVIIVTAWENSSGLVKSVIDSGADDLLLRPFSTNVLGQRILSHVERRKGFVITSEYVGPDRRKDSSRPSNVELFSPPNSLKMKVKDALSIDEASAKLDVALREAREKLHDEKLKRDAFQICILWRLVQDHVPDSAAYRAELAKLKDFTRNISRRSMDMDKEEAAAHCEAVMGAIEGLELGVDRNASMHLLGHSALSLNQVFSPEKSATDHLAEIDSTVAIIRARNVQALAS